VFALGSGSAGSLTYLSFAGMLLGLVALSAAIIFAVQAVIGSPEPVSFALPPDHVPIGLREGLRAVLVEEWNPQHRQSSETRAYDAYLSVTYAMAARNFDPEQIASALEQLEATDALTPGSDEVSRFKAAEHILGLVMGHPIGV
jgi:hypothetical protein